MLIHSAIVTFFIFCFNREISAGWIRTYSPLIERPSELTNLIEVCYQAVSKFKLIDQKGLKQGMHINSCDDMVERS